MALYITVSDKGVRVSGRKEPVVEISDKPVEEIPLDPEVEPIYSVLYDKQIQNTSLIQANVVEIFDKWFQSFFPHNYFREVRIATEAPFTEFKSAIRQIYKKEYPLLLINPVSVEPVDDFIFSTNMINRYSRTDPMNDGETGMKLMYSLCLMETDKIHILYRRNRFAFRFETMIVERSAPRRDDTYNFLLMNMRHRSKFTMARRVATYIPLQMMVNVAAYHGLDIKSDEFMAFVNQISTCPIEKRMTPNGKTQFYAHQEIHVHVDIPDFPSRDSVDKAGAIDIAARLTDSFVFTVDLPAEFIAVIPRDKACEYRKCGKDAEIDPDELFYINNEIVSVERDLYAPRNIGERFKLVSRYDVQLTKTDRNVVHIMDFLKDMDVELAAWMQLAIEQGLNLEDIVRVKVFTKTEECEVSMSETGEVTIVDADYRNIYFVFLYIDYTELNRLQTEFDTQHIGTVKQDL